MIFIEETYPGDNRVVIQVEGQLTHETLPILKRVCQKHQQSLSEKDISIDLNGLTHIGRESKAYLREIREWVLLADLPEFLRLELFPEYPHLPDDGK